MSKRAYEDIFVERQNASQKQLATLMETKQIPASPFSELEVLALLNQLASGDSNNFESSGIGEREGRVFSPLVEHRYFNFAHGAGRSGNLLDPQPKAAGSNILNGISQEFVKEALKMSHFAAKSSLLVPFCTGMSINFIIQCLRLKKVIWLRMDQKSVPKALLLAGCEVRVIECLYENGQLVTNLQELSGEIHDCECVVSTTSCFAPRQPDNVTEIGKLCKQHDKIHIVNNAYGVHSAAIMRELDGCQRADYIVSSLDKNFMVPVGSSIIYSKQQSCDVLAEKYAGRAGNGGNIDIVITLLEMGRDKYTQLENRRAELYDYFVSEMRKVEEIRVHTIDRNEISFCFTLRDETVDANMLASKLFHRGVSGAKALSKGSSFSIDGYELRDFGRGGVYDGPAYITCAASIGVEQRDIDTFVAKLKSLLGHAEK